ncbi:hypothetical protein O3M35_000253 [Rhynocoris fuscipes]|uniref:Copper transport protein n=1 Tax=Rhynocoris fuscipes TaxID=488301 RepID=A0AAW1DLR3_9HEMI
MSFSFGYELHQLLFSSINVTTVAGIVAVCFCTVALVFVYEASKVGLAYSKLYSAILRPNDKPDCFTDDMLLLENQTPSTTTRYAWLLIEMGFYAIEIIMGYVVMLLVMTYNGYLLISVLFSSGIAYFLIGQTLVSLQVKTSKLNLQCQKCITTHPKTSSITSSTEAISDSVTEQERCCLAESNDIVVAETKN